MSQIKKNPIFLIAKSITFYRRATPLFLFKLSDNLVDYPSVALVPPLKASLLQAAAGAPCMP